MGWGHWRVPEISQEVEFRLRVQELEVRKLFKRNPEAVLHHALLLANHGPVVAGTSLTAAVDAMEELEETARLYLLLHGRPTRYLSEEQIDDRHRHDRDR